MDWTLAKNQGPGIAHTVCRALEDSYFATSSTLAGLAFTCRPTKSVYLHNSFIASYYFTICSCKVARCNICKPFARIVSVWQGDVVSQVLHLGISDIWSVWSVTRPTWFQMGWYFYTQRPLHTSSDPICPNRQIETSRQAHGIPKERNS